MSAETYARDVSETHWVKEFQEGHHNLGDVTEVAGRLLHVETLAKAQVTQDIEDEPVHPITHVERRRPFAIFWSHLANEFKPSVDVRMQEDLSITQCCLGKGVVEHTAFACMDTDRGTAPSVDSVDISRP
jgi:hypothetical protein